MLVKATTASVVVKLPPPCIGMKSVGYKPRSNRVSVGTAAALVNGVFEVEKTSTSVAVDGKSKGNEEEKLEPLWDDGYGTLSVKDYLDLAKDIIKPDAGPPRWFCPLLLDGNDAPLPNSPILLFLPGMDGLGLGLVLHQKSLRKVFEVRCMHIPVNDRTPFIDLVAFVEETVRFEHALYPSRPIYLVGDSLGGCLALAVAARNPGIDLVVILSNPATSFDRTPLKPILPVLEGIPETLTGTIPYLLSFVMGDPIKMASVSDEYSYIPNIEKLSDNLVSLLPRLSGLSDIIPKATLSWKLKLLKSAAAYTNSRLHAVKAEVLLLASGKDNMLPSRDEAQRLSTNLQNCRVCYFKDNGHTLLLEDGINLLTVIKGTLKYRRTGKHDFIKDYLPPSMSEYRSGLQGNG